MLLMWIFSWEKWLNVYETFMEYESGKGVEKQCEQTKSTDIPNCLWKSKKIIFTQVNTSNHMNADFKISRFCWNFVVANID